MNKLVTTAFLVAIAANSAAAFKLRANAQKQSHLGSSHPLPGQSEDLKCLDTHNQPLAAIRVRAGGDDGMVEPEKKVQLAFLLAMSYNFSALIFSKGFSNNLGEVDPVFDSFGAKCIVLWGLAYGAASRVYHLVPALSLVFVVEKALYGWRWLVWLANNHQRLKSITNEDFLTGAFFTIYGAGDLLFMVVFAYAAWVTRDNLRELKFW